MKPWLKRRKNLGVYETLFAELQLEDDCNYKDYLQITSENLKKYFS